MCHSLTNFLDSEIKVRHFHLKQLVTSSETCRYLKKQQQNHRSLSPLSRVNVDLKQHVFHYFMNRFLENVAVNPCPHLATLVDCLLQMVGEGGDVNRQLRGRSMWQPSIVNLQYFWFNHR